MLGGGAVAPLAYTIKKKEGCNMSTDIKKNYRTLTKATNLICGDCMEHMIEA